jgi:phage terminase small subunit
MVPTRPKQLTNKERAFVRSLAQGRSLTDAALAAGYSSKNPGQSGWQALENIRHKVPELLDRHGPTDEALIEKHLKPLLNATENEVLPTQGESHRFSPRSSQCHQTECFGHSISLEGFLCKAGRREY